MLLRPVLSFATLALLAAMLSACQTSQTPQTQAASAQEGQTLHALAEKAGIATKPAEAKDFVKAARGPVGDYLPVGVTPDNGKIKVRDEKGVKQLRDELESTARKAEKAGEAAKQ
jgi:hypothetical protein